MKFISYRFVTFSFAVALVFFCIMNIMIVTWSMSKMKHELYSTKLLDMYIKSYAHQLENKVEKRYIAQLRRDLKNDHNDTALDIPSSSKGDDAPDVHKPDLLHRDINHLSTTDIIQNDILIDKTSLPLPSEIASTDGKKLKATGAHERTVSSKAYLHNSEFSTLSFSSPGTYIEYAKKKSEVSSSKVFLRATGKPSLKTTATGHKFFSQTSINNTVFPSITYSLNKKPGFHPEGLYCDWWSDVFIVRVTRSVKWHPLFPHIPQKVSTTFKLTDNARITEGYVRRLYGFLFTNQTAMFDFQLRSRDGLELVLVDTTMTLDNFTSDYNVTMGTTVFYSKFTLAEMLRQDKIIPGHELFSLNERVKLISNRVYFIEIIQGGYFYGSMDIKWRTGNESFKVIDQNNLFRLNEDITQTRRRSLSLLYNLDKPQIKYPPNKHEITRMNFHSTPVLNATKLYDNSDIICDPITRHPAKLLYEYFGKDYLDRQVVYPKEYFNYTGGWPVEHLLLNESEAVSIGDLVMKELQKNLNRSISLQNIVHIQKNVQQKFSPYPDWKKTLYFVELDVLSPVRHQQTYRTTHFIRHDKTQNRVCFIKEYQCKSDVIVNLLTPVKNQAVWIHHLLGSLETIMTKTNEENIRLILIDYNSTDADIRDVLTSYRVPFKYVKIQGTTFNKVKALNVGLRHVTNDEIAFVLDLHLDMPLNIFDRIRKQTIQGLAGFSPTLLKFYPGQHEQYTDLDPLPPTWIDDGFGMMALFKSDWEMIGGMNEKKFGTQWGGEDWECVDRIVKHGLYLFHNRLPRFYHIYHQTHSTWDGKHIW